MSLLGDFVKIQKENKQLKEEAYNAETVINALSYKVDKQTKILDEIKEIISVAIEEDGYIEPEMNLSKIEQILEKIEK